MVKWLSTKITKSIILLLIGVLLVSFANLTYLVKANPAIATEVSISGIVDGATYNNDSLALTMKVDDFFLNYTFPDSNINFYLDGQVLCKVNFVNGSDTILLNNLTQGEHKIYVNGHATYTANNSNSIIASFNSATASFNIDFKPTQQTVSFSSIAIITLSAVIVSVALLVIYRKQNLKRKDKQATT
jgi:hypothetical protein